MCGRFSLTSSTASLEEHFNLVQSTAYRAGYNITPGTDIPVIRLMDGKRVMALHSWGFVPHWARDAKFRPINAKAETIDQKPFFRSAFRQSRCLIPANGFYEWQQTAEGNKQPFYIRLPDSELMAFAGLYDHREKDGEVIDSCVIITTRASESIAGVHARMPVILLPQDYSGWLAEGDKTLLQPCPEELQVYAVSNAVNNPKNDDRSLLEPLS